jgi:hypothetical protein
LPSERPRQNRLVPSPWLGWRPWRRSLTRPPIGLLAPSYCHPLATPASCHRSATAGIVPAENLVPSNPSGSHPADEVPTLAAPTPTRGPSSAPAFIVAPASRPNAPWMRFRMQ